MTFYSRGKFCITFGTALHLHLDSCPTDNEGKIWAAQSLNDDLEPKSGGTLNDLKDIITNKGESF